MTAEQLKELARDFKIVMLSSDDAAHFARRAIAAEKLVEAYFDESVSTSEFADMMNAYREASK